MIAVNTKCIGFMTSSIWSPLESSGETLACPPGRSYGNIRVVYTLGALDLPVFLRRKTRQAKRRNRAKYSVHEMLTAGGLDSR